jgi:riboflavin biosynthesis pyrimidine reductase
MTAITALALPIADALPAAPATMPWSIELLWESHLDPSLARVRGGKLPAGLRSRFPADIAIPLRTDRPTIVANFVSTLDGAVALDRAGASGGREISGGFEPDRFVMGLLRSAADAVLVGAGTVRASRTHGWSPGHAYPPSASQFAAWRRELGLTSDGPATVLVTASGALDHRDLPDDQEAPIIVATTVSGARRLAGRTEASQVEIVPLADGPRIPVDALVGFLGQRGFELVLSEGGPNLFGELLAARLVDEVFLTVAPQLAGRSDSLDRLALVEGVGFAPSLAPWGRLRSVMRSADHLFIRYQLSSPDRKDLP